MNPVNLAFVRFAEKGVIMNNLKIILNPNEQIVKSIKKRLLVTNNMCPCVPESEWNDSKKCMCQDFKEQTITGPCCCNLYIKIESTEDIKQ